MTEIKEIFERVLAAPPPPRYDSAQVLTAARRARRRAQLMTAGTLGVLAMTLAAAATLPVTLGQDTTQPVPPAATTTGSSTTPAAPAREPALAPDDLAGHASRLRQRLVDALPAGIAVGPGESSAWTLDGEAPPEIRAAVGAVVPLAGPADNGLLSAVVAVDGTPVPAADLCAPPVAARLGWYTESAVTSCEVITVDAVPVRVTTERDPTMGAVLRAVRLLDGGFVSVQLTARPAEQSWQPDSARPWRGSSGQYWLGTPSPLTGEQLAAMAADPALLP